MAAFAEGRVDAGRSASLPAASESRRPLVHTGEVAVTHPLPSADSEKGSAFSGQTNSLSRECKYHPFYRVPVIPLARGQSAVAIAAPASERSCAFPSTCARAETTVHRNFLTPPDRACGACGAGSGRGGFVSTSPAMHVEAVRPDVPRPVCDNPFPLTTLTGRARITACTRAPAPIRRRLGGGGTEC